MSATILVVDDEKTFRMVAQAALVAEGYGVDVAADGRRALERVRAGGVDLVVLDRNLPDIDGLTLLPMLRAEGAAGGEEPHVVMVTAYADVENAVQALKAGAYDYLTKPIQLPALIATARRALEARQLRRRAASFSGQSRRRTEREMFMGESAAMRAVIDLVDKVAASPDTTVLIEGESGAGKELVARLIHARTPRRSDGPFVELNCAAIPETLLESELFGHEKGAFTDAQSAKEGLLEEAEGGSLFLDEIGDMAAATQAKLLKVLETQKFRRLGGGRDLASDVRYIAATHRDLPAAVERGTFRLDLFHRLDVFRIRIPPLRDRREDILPLARFFLREHAGRIGKPARLLAPEVETRLLGYAFPGNVRELRNIIERAVILEASEVVGAEALALGGERAAGGGVTAGAAAGWVAGVEATLGRPPNLEELERAYLERLLEHAGGNRTQVARLMGVSYPTVMKKITDYGIDISKWK